MRAMVMPRFGGPELFEERDVGRPEPGPGEVLVRVVVAGTNPIDTKLRADGSFAGLEPPVVLGSDVSGVVEEVGAGVADLAPGDEVYYTPEVFGPGSNGGYAEYNLVSAGIVAKKPASISHEEAAAVPLAGGTAYEVLVRRLAVRVGETVLIHGGAGGRRVVRRPDSARSRRPRHRHRRPGQPADPEGTSAPTSPSTTGRPASPTPP
jgi:NADPH2:quinone reductase